MEQLWKINVGTGFNAPPMTFEVNGKQYVAILSGLSPISAGGIRITPELRGAAQPDHAVRVRRCNDCSPRRKARSAGRKGLCVVFTATASAVLQRRDSRCR